MSTTIKLGPGQARELSHVPGSIEDAYECYGANTISGIAMLGGISYSTARVHLKALVKRGLIIVGTTSNGTDYFSKTEAGRNATIIEKWVNNSLSTI